MTNRMLDGFILATDAEPAAPANVGFGSIVLLVAVAALMVWMGYLWLNSRRGGRLEDTPANLQPGLTDDELETSKLGRVLTSAVVSAAVLSAVMGVYYANESGRQANAAEKIHEKDVEEGERWFEFFSCVNCHGPGAVGGGAEFVEARSELSTSWVAPSLNDIFFRFNEEEIAEIIIYGRDGTPMPANGLDGGGAMTSQEIEQIMAYLESIQISQGEALDEVEGAVDAAANRLGNAEATVVALLDAKRAEREDIDAAPGKFAVVKDFPDEIAMMLQSPGTCTETSAHFVESSCSDPGADSDRDGLSDQAEFQLAEYASEMLRVLTLRQEGTLDLVSNPAYAVQFSRSDAFTNEDAEGNPIPDLVEAEALLGALDGEVLTLGVISERLELFQGRADDGIAYLEKALAERKWVTDVSTIANKAGLTLTEAERASGLFNAYCARCHTGGYNAGVAFQQEVASGAWGPTLLDGRAIAQFPDEDDHMRFIIDGSEFAVNYGINGLGSGRMPGFGRILSTDDLELIMKFERGL
ncbi:MAG: c-type cytochrome [bacterium]|nr:c-type cytochrome [bacterium]